MIGLTTAPPIAQAIAGGALFGLIFFAKVRFDPDNPESFDPVAFLFTIGLSSAVGGAFDLVGIAPTFDHFAFVLITYAGAIALIEGSIKAFARGDRYAAQTKLQKAGRSVVDSTIGLGTSREEIEESVEAGASETGKMDDEELREEWGGPYPDEETFYLVDDSEDGDPTVYEEASDDDDGGEDSEPDGDISPA